MFATPELEAFSVIGIASISAALERALLALSDMRRVVLACPAKRSASRTKAREWCD
jgi:hypothetical protein